ncbi:HAMP domain-containing protein, partial [Angustibacter luteus]
MSAVTTAASTEPSTAPAGPRVRHGWFVNRSVRTKLGAGVAIALVGLAALMAVSVNAVQTLESSNQRLLELGRLQSTLMGGDMAHDAVRGDVLQAILFAGKPEGDEASDDLPAQSKTLQDSVEVAKVSGLGGATAAAVAAVGPDLDAYTSSAARLVGLTLTNPAAAQAAYPAFLESFRSLETSLSGLTETVDQAAQQATKEADDAKSSALRSLWITVVLTGLAVALLSLLVARSIAGAVGRVRAAVQALADGDLTHPTGLRSRDELGRMGAALDHALENLRAVLEQVSASAVSVASSSEELSV